MTAPNPIAPDDERGENPRNLRGEMSEPTNPDDTAALAAMLMRVVRCGGTGDGWNFAEAARTVAHALIPPGHTVVRTDDLRAVLEDWWEAGHDAPPVFTSEGVKPYWGEHEQAIYDRLRAKVEGQ